jgi:hypothetical protein
LPFGSGITGIAKAAMSGNAIIAESQGNSGFIDRR